ISLDRECKEATLWYGALAGAEPRRATALPSGASLAGNPARSAPCPVADRVGPWVFDPDPALVRAGLVGTLAGLHGLARVPPGNDYLTGPRRVETPWLAAFEVLAVLPMDRKRIGRAAREAGIGPLE